VKRKENIVQLLNCYSEKGQRMPKHPKNMHEKERETCKR